MWVLSIVSILCEVKRWANVDSLNDTLKPFLDMDDSITSIEDNLYKFFNMNTIDLAVISENGENQLEIQFYDDKESVLPEFLERLINIHSLFLQNNNFKDLPHYFTKFTSLYLLNLSSNNFNKLPKVLFSLQSLTILNLNNNFFESIEDNIELLGQLTVLDFSRNNIRTLSNNLTKLKSLHSLNLSYNPNIIRNNDDDNDFEKDANFWKKLPSSIESLHLKNIRLKSIPYNFNLPKLSILRLSYNLLENLPQSFKDCSRIFIFDVSFNHLKTIPSFVYQWETLKELNLKKNKIESSFRLKKNMLSTLEELDLSFCDINKFEIEGYNIMGYCSLTGKHIRPNILTPSLEKSIHKTVIPKTTSCIIYSLESLLITITNIFIVPNLLIFPNLLDLKIINVDSSDVSSEITRHIFYDLQNMQLLEDLELVGFNFVTIPKEIFNLRRLQSLFLNFCGIKEIPDEIVTLPNVREIDLHNNNIENINPKIFEFDREMTIVLSRNPFKYLPSEINNNNLSFKLEFDGVNISFFNKDDDNLGIMDISYKKVSQIIRYDFFKDFSIPVEDIYNKASDGEYKWELNQMLMIKNKEITKSKKDYNDIANYWNILENHINDTTIKNEFHNYLKHLYNIERRGENETNSLLQSIKNTIKNYVEVVFEILINLVNTSSTEMIETIIITIYPGLSVCVDGQLQHFSYVYHLLIGDYDQSTTLDYFIQNKIARLKYDALREITTSNNEKQNVHIFLYWQSELSEILGLPSFQQLYGMNTQSSFLQCREYILYQFFQLMSVRNVVKNLFESINNANETITMASQYIYKKNDDMDSLKKYLDYEGDIEYLKIKSITEKGVYFILEEMGLIKKTADKNIKS